MKEGGALGLGEEGPLDLGGGGKPVGSDRLGQRLGVVRERGVPTCLVSVVIVLRYQYGSLYIGFVKMRSTKNSLDGFAANI